jgi:hypothetical protein
VPPGRAQGILKRKTEGEADYMSQFSQQKTVKSFGKGNTMHGSGNAPINWKLKRERMDLYKMQKSF